MEIFLELTTIVCLATLVSVLMRFLKQPLIVGYIFTGILAGPQFINVLHSTEYLEGLSKIGIAILLFIVGLNLSPKVIKEVGKVALVSGIGQVVFTTLIGFGIATSLGYGVLPSLYIAIALTFSSTIVILKILSDKGDLNKLYGKIAVGFLIVQDIIAAIVLVGVSSFSGTGSGDFSFQLGFTLLKAVNIIGILYLFSVYLLPRITRYVAASQELLFMFSISWGLVLASVFYFFNFSAEIGALAAGVMFSVTPYATEIGSRLKPLRDFFLLLFFILIGSQIDLSTLSEILYPAIVLSLFVLIGNPLIMIVLMNLLGYKRRVSFMVGLTVAQVSEFSLILAALAFEVGQLSKNELSLITLVGLLTIAGSTYLMLYSHLLYPYAEKFLKLLELRKPKAGNLYANESYDIILFGYDRVGTDFIKSFEKLDKQYLVVDFNPRLIKVLQQKNIPFRYGDVEDIEFLHELNLEKTSMFVSTVPDYKTSLLLLKRIRNVNKSAIVILLTHDVSSAKELYLHGASYVIMPHYLGALYASKLINRLQFDKKEFEEERIKHLAYIEHRN